MCDVREKETAGPASPADSLSTRRARRRRLFIAISIGGPFALALAIELALRLFFGYPHGALLFTIPGPGGLYPPNATIEMVWGPIAYTVESNSLGFRGGEIAAAKPAGRMRIAAIGDSMTDGFFVDNPDTYPAILERELRAGGLDAEVINAGRAKASIGKELAILREQVLPLAPDLVLLMFVTNDISDIRGRAREEILGFDIRADGPGDRLAYGLLTRTALGEFIGDAYFRMRYDHYRPANVERDKRRRYDIEGGRDFAANAERFDAAFAEFDGLVLREPFGEEVEALLGNYLAALAEFKAACDAGGADLIYLFCPAYSQVYDPAASMLIRDRLREACEGLEIEFLDLTPAFRERGAETALHLAPLDYHLNPEGNAAVAGAVADYLLRRGTVRVPASGPGRR